MFLEKGGHDSSYQAVAALKLQVWVLHFPDQKLEAAIDRAVRWELGRVGPDGQVDVAGNTRTGLGQEQWMGHEKGVNYSEVTACLLYYYARTGDQQALAAARRIVERRKTSETGQFAAFRGILPERGKMPRPPVPQQRLTQQHSHSTMASS